MPNIHGLGPFKKANLTSFGSSWASRRGPRVKPAMAAKRAIRIKNFFHGNSFQETDS